MKKRYKITISYDGTNYCGWQTQPNEISIQEKIQDALETLLKTRPNLTGSGRTDSGVHALGQVAHFDAEKEPSLKSLNALLPKDIRITKIQTVPDTFHARYSALGKIYQYHIHTLPHHSPFTELYSHQAQNLDLDILKKGTELFVGKRDFTSFANEAHRGSAKNNPIKDLRRLDLIHEGHVLILEFEGDGFLYKMVRNITGTLLDIALKKLPLDSVQKIFDAKDRSKASAVAPAKGLFLKEVIY